MVLAFEVEAAEAAFSPLTPEGRFASPIASYLTHLAQTRPSVVLAFAPKAAGTFLRSAAITATGGKLVRTVHAQGGRDGSFYLPTFLLYYAAGIPDVPLVTHVHMQALPANRYFMEALDLRPAIMVRPLADMLLSYLEMMEAEPGNPEYWLNIRVPADFGAWEESAKADFIIEMMAPWYVSYFATWLDWAASDRRVLVLDYDEFRDSPAETLEALLMHSRLPRSHAHCEAAVQAVWQMRDNFRFRHGVPGRGRARFNTQQMARLQRLVAFYPELASWTDRLIPPP